MIEVYSRISYDPLVAAGVRGESSGTSNYRSAFTKLGDSRKKKLRKKNLLSNSERILLRSRLKECKNSLKPSLEKSGIFKTGGDKREMSTPNLDLSIKRRNGSAYKRANPIPNSKKKRDNVLSGLNYSLNNGLRRDKRILKSQDRNTRNKSVEEDKSGCGNGLEASFTGPKHNRRCSHQQSAQQQSSLKNTRLSGKIRKRALRISTNGVGKKEAAAGKRGLSSKTSGLKWRISGQNHLSMNKSGKDFGFDKIAKINTPKSLLDRSRRKFNSRVFAGLTTPHDSQTVTGACGSGSRAHSTTSNSRMGNTMNCSVKISQVISGAGQTTTNNPTSVSSNHKNNNLNNNKNQPQFFRTITSSNYSSAKHNTSLMKSAGNTFKQSGLGTSQVAAHHSQRAISNGLNFGSGPRVSGQRSGNKNRNLATSRPTTTKVTEIVHPVKQLGATVTRFEPTPCRLASSLPMVQVPPLALVTPVSPLAAEILSPNPSVGLPAPVTPIIPPLGSLQASAMSMSTRRPQHSPTGFQQSPPTTQITTIVDLRNTSHSPSNQNKNQQNEENGQNVKNEKVSNQGENNDKNSKMCKEILNRLEKLTQSTKKNQNDIKEMLSLQQSGGGGGNGDSTPRLNGPLRQTIYQDYPGNSLQTPAFNSNIDDRQHVLDLKQEIINLKKENSKLKESQKKQPGEQSQANKAQKPQNQKHQGMRLNASVTSFGRIEPASRGDLDAEDAQESNRFKKINFNFMNSLADKLDSERQRKDKSEGSKDTRNHFNDNTDQFRDNNNQFNNKNAFEKIVLPGSNSDSLDDYGFGTLPKKIPKSQHDQMILERDTEILRLRNVIQDIENILQNTQGELQTRDRFVDQLRTDYERSRQELEQKMKEKDSEIEKLKKSLQDEIKKWTKMDNNELLNKFRELRKKERKLEEREKEVEAKLSEHMKKIELKMIEQEKEIERLVQLNSSRSGSGDGNLDSNRQNNVNFAFGQENQQFSKKREESRQNDSKLEKDDRRRTERGEQRISELERREIELAEARSALEIRAKELDERKSELDRREKEIVYRQNEASETIINDKTLIESNFELLERLKQSEKKIKDQDRKLLEIDDLTERLSQTEAKLREKSRENSMILKKSRQNSLKFIQPKKESIDSLNPQRSSIQSKGSKDSRNFREGSKDFGSSREGYKNSKNGKEGSLPPLKLPELPHIDLEDLNRIREAYHQKERELIEKDEKLRLKELNLNRREKMVRELEDLSHSAEEDWVRVNKLLRKEMNQLRDQTDELASEKHQLDKHTHQLTKDKEELIKITSETQILAKKFEREIKKLKKEKNDPNQELNRSITELDQLKMEHSGLQTHQNNLNTQNRALADQQRKFNLETSNLKSEQDRLKTELSQSKNENEKAKGDIQALRKKIKILEKSFSEIDRDNQLKNDVIVNLRKELNTMTFSQKDFDEMSSVKDMEIDDLKRRVQKMEDDKAESETRIRELCKAKVDISFENDNLKQQIDENEELRKKLDEELGKLSKMLEHEKEQRRELETIKITLKTEIEGLNEKMVNLTGTRESLEQKCSDLRLTIEELKNTLETFRIGKESAEAKNASLREELESVRKFHQGFSDTERELNKLSEQNLDLKAVKIGMEDQLEAVELENSKLIAQLGEVENWLKIGEEERLELKSQIKGLLGEIDGLKQTEASLGDEIRGHETQIEALMKAKAELEQQAKHSKLSFEEMKIQYETDLLRVSDKKDEIEISNIKLRAEVERIRETLHQLKREAMESENRVSLQGHEMEGLNERIKEVEALNGVLERRLEESNALLGEVRGQKAFAENKAGELVNKIAELESVAEELRMLVEGKDDEIGRLSDENRANRSELEGRYQKVFEKYEAALDENNELRKQSSVSEKRVFDVENELKISKKKLVEIEKELSVLEEERDQIRVELGIEKQNGRAWSEQSKNFQKKILELQGDISGLKKELEEKTSLEEELRRRLEQLGDEKKSFEKKLKKSGSRMEELLKIISKLKHQLTIVQKEYKVLEQKVTLVKDYL